MTRRRNSIAAAAIASLLGCLSHGRISTTHQMRGVANEHGRDYVYNARSASDITHCVDEDGGTSDGILTNEWPDQDGHSDCTLVYWRSGVSEHYLLDGRPTLETYSMCVVIEEHESIMRVDVSTISYKIQDGTRMSCGHGQRSMPTLREMPTHGVPERRFLDAIARCVGEGAHSVH